MACEGYFERVSTRASEDSKGKGKCWVCIKEWEKREMVNGVNGVNGEITYRMESQRV